MLPLLDIKDSAFVCIDLQKRILPAMYAESEIIKNANILLGAAAILEIPVFVTEQYPQGLGQTDERILIPNSIEIFSKTTFSIFGCNEFLNNLKMFDIKNLIIFGIETHVCVHQSVNHAIENGYKVHIVSDCCSSRAEKNHEIGISSMSNMGAKVISTEMAIFQHIDSSKHRHFKELSKLIK